MATATVGALRAVLSADTADFDKAMKGADANIRKLADSMQKQLVPSQSRVNSLVKDFLGSREIGMAQAYAKAVEQIGGANKLVASDQAKVNRVVQEALQHYRALGVQAPSDLKALALATKGLESPTKALGTSIDGVIGKARALAGVFGVTLGAAAIGSFIKGTLDAADQVGDLALKMGISVEAAQRFQYAARQSGAEIENVSAALVKMNNNLAEGDKSTVSALTAVGLKFSDIRGMKPEDAFRTIADAIGRIPDPMLQSKVALELFGKAGADILPMIRENSLQASDGVQVMSDETVKALKDAKQAWENFWNDVTIITGNALAEIMPQIRQMLNDLRVGFGFIAGLVIPGFGNPFGVANATVQGLDASKQKPMQDLAAMLNTGSAMSSHGPKGATFLSKEEQDAADRKAVEATKAAKRFNDSVTEYIRVWSTGMTDAQREMQKVQAAAMSRLGLTSAFQWGQGIVNKSPLSSFLGPGINLGFTKPLPSMSLPMPASKARGPMGLTELLSGVTVPGYNAGDRLRQGISGIGGMLPQTILQAIQGGGNVKQSIGALLGGNLGTSMGGQWKTMFGAGKLGGKLGGTVAGLSGGIASAGLSAVLGNGGGNGMMSNIGSYAAAGMMFGPWGAAVGAGIGAIVGIIKKGANNAKKARQEFAKELGFGDQNGLLDKLRTMGPEGNRLVNTALNSIGKNDQAANKKWMDDVRSFFDRLEKVPGKVNELSQALSRFGGAIPDQLSPLLDSILGNPNLSADLRMQLEGMKKPSWQAAQEMAQALGVNPAALGAGFNQSRLAEQAFNLKRSLDTFAKFAGSDQNAILKDMADEFSALAADAKKTGAALPRAIQAFLRSVDDMGLLLDENGNRIDSSLLTFADIEDEYLAQAVSLLEQIRDLLTPPTAPGDELKPNPPGFTPRLPGTPPTPPTGPTPIYPGDPGFQMFMPSLSGASYGSAYAADMNGLSMSGQSMTVILERDGRAEARWLVPFIPNEVERLRLA